jgi:hypothetical protein
MTPQSQKERVTRQHAVTYAKIHKQLHLKFFGYHVCLLTLKSVGHNHLVTVRYRYDKYINSGERTFSNQTNPTHTRIFKSSSGLHSQTTHFQTTHFISCTRQSENLHCSRPPIKLSRSCIKYFECLVRHVGGVELLLHWAGAAFDALLKTERSNCMIH